MALLARSLRPILSGDADALRYIRAVEIADKQSLEPAVRKAYTDFVVGCKQDGIWSAIKASCILMGARTLSGALVPLVGLAPTNNNFVSGDYNRETGLTGDASTKWIDTNASAQSFSSQNSVHFCAWVQGAATTTGSKRIGGDSSVGGGVSLSFSYSTLLVTGAANATASSVEPAVLSAAGFFGAARSSSTTHRIRNATEEISAARNSVSPAPRDVFLFAYNENSGAQPTTLSNTQISFYSLGEHLDMDLLRARLDALFTSVGNAIP